ncbi:MAG: flagellar biosynthesis protein FlhA [Spirochaetes bacterium]|nr:flagellar biosynthesis protein FlhA [Spirochaetota bacterium]MBU0955347.1 flagellar biosynthesis protein FlhA [Spirochaetota bacterium]
MAETRRFFRETFMTNFSDYAVAIAVVSVIFMIIIPLPTVLLDMLMAINLALSLFIVLLVLYTRKAVDFSIFPTVLLITTIFGLALNISSTRLILSQGIDFDGRIVLAFSSFVTGAEGTSGIVVGFIMFIILIAVQAIVITKGATRISEVAARFTLDALPGKQMNIDAELNSGAISEEDAKKRKAELQREVDFYGQMDGASKFISGNVALGILISVINLIGGFVVGMLIHGEPFQLALTTYASLTIGDGIVSQLPALLVSTATGLIITRSNTEGTFGEEATKQFTQNARIYWIASIVMFVMAFIPGFPWYVFLVLSAATGFLAYRLSRRTMAASDKAKAREGDAGAKKPESSQELSPVVPLDPISLELGYGLIPLVDKDKGAELLERVTRIRKESALDMGLVVPRIRIIDNMRLEPSEYCFKIKGVEVGRGIIRLSFFLAINPGGVSQEVPGEKTRDPAFGLPAVWISEDNRDKAERAGYTVVDPPSIIATHLTEIIKRYASEILGRQEVQSMLEALRKDYPAVVEDVQKHLSLGEIQKVLQGLLREQVSIRNLVAIFETMADYSGITKDAGFLVEKARQALGRQLCLQYADQDKMMRVLTVEPSLEQRIIDSRVDTHGGTIAALEPAVQRQWIKSLTTAIAAIQQKGYFPMILCSEAARALVKSSTEREIPDLVVLSVPEVASDIQVEAIGEIRIEG